MSAFTCLFSNDSEPFSGGIGTNAKPFNDLIPELPVSLSEAVIAKSTESPATMSIRLLAGTPVITGLIASGVEVAGALFSEDKVPFLFGKVTFVLATYEPP